MERIQNVQHPPPESLRARKKEEVRRSKAHEVMSPRASRIPYGLTVNKVLNVILKIVPNFAAERARSIIMHPAPSEPTIAQQPNRHPSESGPHPRRQGRQITYPLLRLTSLNAQKPLSSHSPLQIRGKRPSNPLLNEVVNRRLALISASNA